jgi:hypothetical protein
MGDGFFGEWKVGPPIVKQLPDGGVVTIIREGDGTGHYWERGTRTEGHTSTAITPERTWLKSWHPSHDPMHPKAAGGVRESTEWGRVKEPKGFHGGGHTNYTKTTITYPAGAGGGRNTIVDQSSYNPTTGDRDHSVTIKHADGTQSRSFTHNSPDGSWRIVTVTTDERGHGQRHTTAGKGDKVTKDETEDVDQGDSESNSGSEDPDPDPPEATRRATRTVPGTRSTRSSWRGCSARAGRAAMTSTRWETSRGPCVPGWTRCSRPRAVASGAAAPATRWTLSVPRPRSTSST